MKEWKDFREAYEDGVRDGINKEFKKTTKLIHKLHHEDLYNRVKNNPKKFSWLGNGSRRKIDFIDGYEYAFNQLIEERENKDGL